MKRFNLSLFLGCFVIGIGIVVAGVIIANKIDKIETPHFPSNLSVVTTDGTQQFDEFLAFREAAEFVKVHNDHYPANLEALIDSGELDGTFTIIQGDYVFSKEKLTQWMGNRIG